ncbi:Serine/threonine-protein kinase ppk15, partial [Zancudomyces culisetae]
LVSALDVLRHERIMHCDIKPENIVLVRVDAPHIKLIDFGSACFETETGTQFTYIQSRFYRSPEVLLGLRYDCAVDMWSVGCVVAELFLGLPLFPGSSQKDQVARIVNCLGYPPQPVLASLSPKSFQSYFASTPSTLPCNPESSLAYLILNKVPYPSSSSPSSSSSSSKPFTPPSFSHSFSSAPNSSLALSPATATNPARATYYLEYDMRLKLVDFLLGMLTFDKNSRLTPLQALAHPFLLS